MVAHCPLCGQETDLPILFSRLRQMIFTFIWNNPGCSVNDIWVTLYPNRQERSNTIYVHINRIKTKLLDTEYRLARSPNLHEPRYKIIYATKGPTNAPTVFPTSLR